MKNRLKKVEPTSISTAQCIKNSQFFVTGARKTRKLKHERHRITDIEGYTAREKEKEKKP